MVRVRILLLTPTAFAALRFAYLMKARTLKGA